MGHRQNVVLSKNVEYFIVGTTIHVSSELYEGILRENEGMKNVKV